MELIVLIPLMVLLGGIAIYMALNDHPIPASSAAIVAMPAARTRPAPESGTDAAAGSPVSAGESTLLTADVLLADALTEMIGLKAEMYHLRVRVESLNKQVALLSGDGPRPSAPAAAKRPARLKLVA